MGTIWNWVAALANRSQAKAGETRSAHVEEIAQQCPWYLESLDWAAADRQAALCGLDAGRDAVLRFLGGARAELEHVVRACESGERSVCALEILFGRLTYAEVLVHNAHDALKDEHELLWQESIGLLACLLDQLACSIAGARAAADAAYQATAARAALRVRFA